MDLATTQDNTIIQLFAGDFPRVTKPVVIASGSGLLLKGTLLGKVTASGKYVPYNDANVDGSQTAKLVLAEDADDATLADVNAIAFASGHFNSAALAGYNAAAGVDFEGTPIFIGTDL